MIAPATPMTIKGVIWYQGETNSGLSRAQQYYRIFPALINDWRRAWNEGDFPFLFVQISSFTSTPYEDWGMIRDAQRRTLDLTNTAMAVSIDVGEPDNVHPADKQTVAARLALGARALAYGEKVEYAGPLFRQATLEGNGMRVYFNHTAGELVLKSSDGFELAGTDHHFFPATARLEDDSVVVTSAQVPHPRYVRYAWQNAPTASLFNKVDLPASTFTSEDPVPAPEMPHAPGK
jgi:sialate O-acetylesterase